LYERLKILGLLRLGGGDDNVFTSLLASPGFIKHAIGLACTGCVTKKNLKWRTPTLVLFRLRLQEESFWTRWREFGDAQRVNLPATAQTSKRGHATRWRKGVKAGLMETVEGYPWMSFTDKLQTAFCGVTASITF
jgi:hypothetical protein